MKRKKKWICVIAAMMMLLLVPSAVQAKSTDVTKKMSSNAKIKRLTRLAAYYTDAEVSRVKKGKQ